jgi:hypothetical protein
MLVVGIFGSDMEVLISPLRSNVPQFICVYLLSLHEKRFVCHTVRGMTLSKAAQHARHASGLT